MCLRVLDSVLSNLSANTPHQIDRSAIEQLQKRGLLSLVLVSNQSIKKLNNKWRSKNQPTDVLSFPMGLEPPPAGIPWEFGEVVISTEKAAEQAQSYGHTLQRELAFLFAHGVLHVLGFDHETAEEEKDMFGRQREILEAAGFSR